MIIKHFKLSQPEKERLIRIKAKTGVQNWNIAVGHYAGHFQSLPFQAVLIRSLTAMLKWIGPPLPANMQKSMKRLFASAV